MEYGDLDHHDGLIMVIVIDRQRERERERERERKGGHCLLPAGTGGAFTERREMGKQPNAQAQPPGEQQQLVPQDYDYPCLGCKKKDRRDDMIECAQEQCYDHYHMDCLTPPMRVVPEDTWRCPKCRSYDDIFCSECNTDENDAELLLCDGPGCKRGYHLYCLLPKLKAAPEGNWFCPVCQKRVVTKEECHFSIPKKVAAIMRMPMQPCNWEGEDEGKGEKETYEERSRAGNEDRPGKKPASQENSKRQLLQQEAGSSSDEGRMRKRPRPVGKKGPR